MDVQPECDGTAPSSNGAVTFAGTPDKYATTAAAGKAEASLQAALAADNQPSRGGSPAHADTHAPSPTFGQQQIADSVQQRGNESRARHSSERDAPSTSSYGDESFDDEESSSGEEDREGDGSRLERRLSSRSSASSGGRRRRRNILPRVFRGQRCGHCHTCLNPQMKKACLTMRAKQMAEMEKKGELPVSMMGQLAADGSISMSGALPPPRSKQRADFSALGVEERPAKNAPNKLQPAIQDPFTREIQAITNRSGGVETKFLLALQKLFQRETNLERRLVLMQMLKLSPPGTLKEAVQSQKIILELQKWLHSAAESKEFRLAFRVIETLDRLPITLEALKSTGVGKTLAKLRKAGPEELRNTADILVTKWKQAVEGTAVEAAKRPREGAASAGAAMATNKKPKLAEDAVTKEVNAKAELPRQSSVDSAGKPGGRAAVPMEVDDTAMFERRKPAPTLQDTLPPTRKTHQIRVLNDDIAKKLKGADKDTDSPRADAQPAGAVAPLQPAAPARSPGLGSPEAAPDSGAADDASKLGSKPPASAFSSALLSMPLGSSRLSGIGAGVTRIGGLGSQLVSLAVSALDVPVDAAARAAAAAARIPDPPAQPRKEKPKKVSWLPDDQLVLVRWFRQADPAVAVQADASMTTEVDTGAPATAEEIHPPGFVSAAKREHRNEAAALRQHRLDVVKVEEEEAEEAQAVSSHAAGQQQPGNPAAGALQLPQPPPRWAPMVEWPAVFRGPPLAVNREAEYMIPKDKEQQTPGFQEVEQLTGSQPAVSYPGAPAVPDSPQEPPPDTSPPVAPLSIPCPRMEPPPVAADPLPPQQALQSLPLPQAPPQGFLAVQQQPQQPLALVLPPPPQQGPGTGFSSPPAGLGPLPFAPAAAMQQPGFLLAQQPHQVADGRAGATSSSDIERGRGSSDWGRGGARGRGRKSGHTGAEQGGRGGRRPATDGPVRLSQRRPGEHPKPAHLVPCRWHFSAKGCRNGDQCRFSHNPDYLESHGHERQDEEESAGRSHARGRRGRMESK